MPEQRLILLFDGTWNDPDNQTNVYRLARLLEDYDGTTRQRFFYEPGVGTSKFQKIRGGTFGYGLSENLRRDYDWLARRYTEGDEIWIFGFSRGAYTARSLIGLIRKCGLVHITTPDLLDSAEKIYRNKKLKPDCDTCKEFRAHYSRIPRIYFIGVWDTVGALGVPGTKLSEFGKYAWHDTALSGSVDYAYQAVALDEHRKTYQVPLWTTEDGKKKPKNIDVEQRWFIGAHANVGGGYGADDPLADPPLHWMLTKATQAGLKLKPFESRPLAWKTEPKDSYREFMGGLYAGVRWVCTLGKGRYHRSYNTGLKGRPAVNVTVDDSVWERWKEDLFNYKPRTLSDAGIEPDNE